MKFGGLYLWTLQTVGDFGPLPHRDWASGVAHCFHFVMLLSLLVRKFHKWITGPHLNSLNWERPILSQTSVEAVCMPRGLILCTCGRGSDWNFFKVNYFTTYLTAVSLNFQQYTFIRHLLAILNIMRHVIRHIQCLFLSRQRQNQPKRSRIYLTFILSHLDSSFTFIRIAPS